MLESYAASQTADSVASTLGGNRQSKKLLIHVSCAVLVILAIIDCLLLYLWINSSPMRTSARKAEKLRENPDLDYDYNRNRGELPLEDFPDPSGTKLGGRNGAGHFCSTTACAWLNAYLGPDVPAVKQPCEDFYAYVCAQHPHSVYVDGRARLMVAMKEALLGEAQQSAAGVAGGRHSRQSRKGHAVVLQRCLAGGEPVLSKIDVESACEAPSTQVCPSKMPEGPNVISDEFFRRNHNATVDEFVAFVNRLSGQRTLSGSKDRAPNYVIHRRSRWNKSTFPTRWVARACQWVSLSARCHLRGRLQRSAKKLREYQRAWKTIYFAPFMGPQAEPLLELVYRGPLSPRLQACLNIMADAFKDEALTVAKQVLTGAVDDLGGLLSDLGRHTRQVMMKYLRFTAAQEDADAENLAFPRYLLPNEKDDISMEVVGAGNSAAVNMTLFSTEAHFANKERQRRLLVPPGLLGLLVNASSSLGTVLVPAIAAPLLRAMLMDKSFENVPSVSPSRLVNHVSQCLATEQNVSEAIRRPTAAELVILEPLLQLYRRKLDDSEGSGTLLHPSYTNGQLFFVLWALGHCGELKGATLVNTVARNSGHFAEAFQCTTKTTMSAVEKCSPNAQV
ncbi:uncharacterized protein LOC144103578 [Amblyomma americanum]